MAFVCIFFGVSLFKYAIILYELRRWFRFIVATRMSGYVTFEHFVGFFKILKSLKFVVKFFVHKLQQLFDNQVTYHSDRNEQASILRGIKMRKRVFFKTICPKKCFR